MSVYVVDSNFFIQAHRDIYPLDVAFSFWNKVKQLADQGKIISIDKVKKEIYKNNDVLKQWCDQNLAESFFKDTSHVHTNYGHIASWALSKANHYLPNALSEFLDADEADAWLIAFAHADIAATTIVTYETSNPNRKNKIKIPDVCNAHEIKYVNTIEMLRQLGETF
jgi:hypothetical protein